MKEEEDKTLQMRKNAVIIVFFLIFAIVIVAAVISLFTSNAFEDNGPELAKPIIYLYPESEQEVSIKVGYPDKLICTYPKYIDGWNVIAKPNGQLKDTSTGRSFYALYWEGTNQNGSIHEDGFVIKGEDTITFLEEKLEVLGLNEREAQEFIIYWLPRLEQNEYNYIRFQTLEEINEYMPLLIEPVPDTLIRVVMEYKPLDKYIAVKEQQLVKQQNRTGFTVVEWGGTQLK